MTRDEYERRKRRLDEELRAGVELLETAHRYQLRALQLVWAAAGGEGVEIPPPVAVPAAMESFPAATALSVSPARHPRPVRRGPWELYNDVVRALGQVPDFFDRNDICRTIGYEPDRGSLYRALQELMEEGVLAVERSGSGKWPTRYRKTGVSGATVGG